MPRHRRPQAPPRAHAAAAARGARPRLLTAALPAVAHCVAFAYGAACVAAGRGAAGIAAMWPRQFSGARKRVAACGTIGDMDVADKPTGTYLRRVPHAATRFRAMPEKKGPHRCGPRSRSIDRRTQNSYRADSMY